MQDRAPDVAANHHMALPLCFEQFTNERGGGGFAAAAGDADDGGRTEFKKEAGDAADGDALLAGCHQGREIGWDAGADKDGVRLEEVCLMMAAKREMDGNALYFCQGWSQGVRGFAVADGDLGALCAQVVNQRDPLTRQ